MKFIDQVPWFALKMIILVVTPLMVMSPSSAKHALVLTLDFWFDRFSASTYRNGGINHFSTLCLKCPAHKDKVEIKCMGSVGGKTPTEPKLYSSSLTLSTLNKMKLMLCALFIYNMGDKIRRLSMNAAFKM